MSNINKREWFGAAENDQPVASSLNKRGVSVAAIVAIALVTGGVAQANSDATSSLEQPTAVSAISSTNLPVATRLADPEISLLRGEDGVDDADDDGATEVDDADDDDATEVEAADDDATEVEAADDEDTQEVETD